MKKKSTTHAIMKVYFFLLFLGVITCTRVFEYTEKITSATSGDAFAWSMDVNHNNFGILAPHDHLGSVTLKAGVKIRPPCTGCSFGYKVAVNGNFVIVPGWVPVVVWVFETSRTYTHVSTIQDVDMTNIGDVAISEESTIVVGGRDSTMSRVNVYHLSRSSWHLSRTWRFASQLSCVAVSEETIAVGLWKSGSSEGGRVNLYRRTKGEWVLVQTLHPHRPCHYFAASVMISNQRLVVSSHYVQFTPTTVFVYKLNTDSATWIPDGEIVTAWALERGAAGVAVGGGMVGVTAADNVGVSVLYKKHNGIWVEDVVLKASGEFEGERNNEIRIDGNRVYTSRVDRYGYGVVFLHKLPEESTWY